MNVSDTVKKEYQNNSKHKNLILYFPELDLTVPNSQVDYESMHLIESILNKRSIEFVGCIASIFRIQTHRLNEDIKGKKIQVSISTDNTLDEPIKLFNGIVDSAVKQSNKRVKEIVAYDELYEKGKINVAAWYNSLPFPVTMKYIRDSLFEYIGIEQEERDLPNDSVVINKQYDPKSLKALSVIKAICQINGAFGIINRSNKFEYRILTDIIKNNGAYPGPTLLLPFIPGVGTSSGSGTEAESFGFYKKVDYEEFTVKPVDKLTIRQNLNDAGVTYGTGTNNYIIQGNMFTYGLSNEELQIIAENIYKNVHGIAYHPFTSNNNGLPYVECGKDAVSYYMVDYNEKTRDVDSSVKSFYVFRRELTGLQSLRDSYGANGEEYQTEFVTDLQTQIDTVKQSVKQEVEDTIKDYDFTDQFSDYTYDKDYLDKQFENMSQLKVVSVAALPENPDTNTIYLIQGEVTVT